MDVLSEVQVAGGETDRLEDAEEVPEAAEFAGQEEVPQRRR